MFIFLLPGSPDTPKPIGSPGLVRFSRNQQEILQKRLEIDGQVKRHGIHGLEIPWALVWKTVSHYRRWPHYVSTFCAFSTWSPLTTYTPSIIMCVLHLARKNSSNSQQGPRLRSDQRQRTGSGRCHSCHGGRLCVRNNERPNEQTRRDRLDGAHMLFNHLGGCPQCSSACWKMVQMGTVDGHQRLFGFLPSGA